MAVTKLSTLLDGNLVVRGFEISDLIVHVGFADCVHLMLGGELPDEHTRRLVDAMLVSCIDHGANAPSIHIARASASCGIPLASAVAAGVNAIGRHHGGAGEACARVLQEAEPKESKIPGIAHDLVRVALKDKRSIPGYGHRVYKEHDPRARTLLDLARREGLDGAHCRLAEAIERELEQQKGRRLVLNVDGAHAAILSDLGYHWSRVQSFFIIGRTVGLCAHALEEADSGRPLDYLGSSPAEVSYQGPALRSVSGGSAVVGSSTTTTGGSDSTSTEAEKRQ